MPEETQDTRIRLIAQGPNLWRVQVLFEYGLEEQIPERLRQIKRELAEGFGVPDSLLEYINMLSKRKTSRGVLVEIQIRKQPIPASATAVRYLPMKAHDGTEFSSMQIEVDLFPLDPYGKSTTRRMVEGRLIADGVDLSLVNWQLVDEYLQQAQESSEVVYGVIIGQGILPETGRKASIHYPITEEDERFAHSAWLGMRFVKAGDIIVEVSNAIGGLKAGRNVFGREVDPKKSVRTRLEAGPGCKVASRDSVIKATEDGLVLISRQYLDRRERDNSVALPAKIGAEIIQPDRLKGNDTYDLRLQAPTLITGTLDKGSNIRTSSHLLIVGHVLSESQIDSAGVVRIIGDVANANISTKHHLCIEGSVRDSFISSDLTAQIDGHAENCSIYAREIVAAKLTGGSAEALSHSRIHDQSSTGNPIQINRRKFLELQQTEGVTAIQELREQLAIVTDMFGPNIVQRVTEENMQLMLLRWLRKQKTAGVISYTFRDVQDIRNILSVIPTIRAQLTEMGVELRGITSQLGEYDGAAAGSAAQSDSESPQESEVSEEHSGDDASLPPPADGEKPQT